MEPYTPVFSSIIYMAQYYTVVLRLLQGTYEHVMSLLLYKHWPINSVNIIPVSSWIDLYGGKLLFCERSLILSPSVFS